MKRKSHSVIKCTTKSVLHPPDLEHAKTAVLNSLGNPDAQWGYPHAIDELVDRCSEPRLAFNRIIILPTARILNLVDYISAGHNQVTPWCGRHLAYEAADWGLLSADLAAGIGRIKGVKKLGVHLGSWLTAEQGQRLWQANDKLLLKGKRYRALLALLLACGLRRHQVPALTLDRLRQPEDQRAIVDLAGKAGHVPTAPFPIV